MKTILLLVFSLFGCSLAGIPWESEPQNNQGWYDRHDQLLEQTAQHRNDVRITFVGASIIERWLQNGINVWNQYYVPNGGYNYGIGGDRTENVLWRIDNNEFDGITSKVTVLEIGGNNLLAGNTNEDTARGIQEVVNRLKNKMPNSKIILLGVLPRGQPLDTESKKVNAMIADLGDNNTVYWLDMWSDFADADSLKPGLYVEDNLHLTEAGYQVWQRVMDPLLQQLLQ